MPPPDLQHLQVGANVMNCFWVNVFFSRTVPLR